MNSWSEYFTEVPDPRRQTGLTKHLLSDILGLALCAMLCGADDFVEMALFAREREEFLRHKLGFALPNGVPSHDTFRRVFGLLKPDVLEGCLWGWLQKWQDKAQQTPTGATRHLSLDGKVARGSWHYATNVCALTSVSLFCHELRLVLGSVRLPGQGGENTVVPALLELVELKGAIVSGDAAYCQKSLCGLIHERGGDYVWGLKANQRKLFTQVQRAFEVLQEKGQPNGSEPNGGEGGEIEEADVGHGRGELRRVWSVDVSELQLPGELPGELLAAWPGLKSVTRVERVREITSGPKAGTLVSCLSFYVSSLGANAALLSRTIRDHWGIENKEHYVLDVVFAEDRCQTRTDHAPYNLALLRRICLNLLRHNQGKRSLKGTRKAVAWNTDLLCQIMHTPLSLL